MIVYIYICIQMIYTPSAPRKTCEAERQERERQKRIEEAIQRLSWCWSFSVWLENDDKPMGFWGALFSDTHNYPYHMSSCFNRLEICQTRFCEWHANCIHFYPRKSARGKNLKSSSKRRLALKRYVWRVCEVLSEFSVTFYGWFSRVKPPKRKITFGYHSHV